MCRPARKGLYSSGWHLHQSLVDRASGRNLFVPEEKGEPLSPPGHAWLAGLLRHAAASTPFATPTVNGYRRFRPNSLAPDRVTWCHDHRGVMLRVLGGAGDATTRIENRIGESAANPYLYVLSQIVAGLAGLEGGLDPGPADDDPYNAERPMLPTSLEGALDALEGDTLLRAQVGEIFLDYFLRLKRSEAGRFAQWLKDTGTAAGEEPTEWEQNEYFDFF
jgi:glutamine synthetase